MALSGIIMTLVSETYIATYSVIGWDELMAMLFGDDDDRKKAERRKKGQKRFWANAVRSVTRISPVFGSILESALSMFGEEFYPDTLMSSPLSESAAKVGRSAERITKELMKLSDDELEGSASALFHELGLLVNELSATLAGNPFNPLTNRLLRASKYSSNDPVSELGLLDTYYQKVESSPDAMASEFPDGLPKFAGEVRDAMEQIDDITKVEINPIRKDMRETAIDEDDLTLYNKDEIVEVILGRTTYKIHVNDVKWWNDKKEVIRGFEKEQAEIALPVLERASNYEE